MENRSRDKQGVQPGKANNNETAEKRLHALEELRPNSSLMTQRETVDKQMENLRDQLDVLL